MKIVINKCYGGFGLSYEAVMEYAKRKGIKLYAYSDELLTTEERLKHKPKNGLISSFKHVEYHGGKDKNGREPFCVHYSTSPELNKDGTIPRKGYFSPRDINRNDPDLVAVIEKLGKKANGNHAELGVLEIPDGVEWELYEYDGIESVEEKHRSWS